jgi:Tfp pilus assembly major pilin PilA
MAKIVTLKNSSDEEVYPITTAEAVNGGLYADSEGTQSTATADVTSARIADSAITTDKIANGAVTSDKIDWTALPMFYKSCPTVNPVNIPTAWTGVTPPGWTLTFDAEVGAVYRVEIATTFLSWNGSAASEVDLLMTNTNSTRISTAAAVATGTYGGGVSFGRILTSIITATGTSVTVGASLSVGATGNYARIDNGHIFVMRIG